MHWKSWRTAIETGTQLYSSFKIIYLDFVDGFLTHISLIVSSVVSTLTTQCSNISASAMLLLHCCFCYHYYYEYFGFIKGAEFLEQLRDWAKIAYYKLINFTEQICYSEANSRLARQRIRPLLRSRKANWANVLTRDRNLSPSWGISVHLISLSSIWTLFCFLWLVLPNIIFHPGISTRILCHSKLSHTCSMPNKFHLPVLRPSFSARDQVTQ
jgi:hypothetical protein